MGIQGTWELSVRLKLQAAASRSNFNPKSCKRLDFWGVHRRGRRVIRIRRIIKRRK